MSDWDRINRLELQLSCTQAELRVVVEERDTARRIAVRLEQELASTVMVPMWGEAR